MHNCPDRLELFTPQALNRLHTASLAILEEPGMRIDSARLLAALRAAGARVDEATRVVRFPARLVEDTLQRLQANIRAGQQQIVLNGVVASLTPRALGVKFGGACIEVMDWRTGAVHEPAHTDLVDLVRLGQALPEVASVGNPVVYLREDDGTKVHPRLQRVKTAALIARYTTKAGATEVWNARELKYLMELGQIVRGSRTAYHANPCFITAKETIAPLILEEQAGEVLALLAENELPCTIIPMPISGTSSPLSPASNVALGNAEVLGTFVAVQAACPTANLVGGIISGVFDMKTGMAVFGAPEAVLQDVGLAELHERLYGFDFGVGGYIDAKYPGAQIMLEVCGRFSLLARTGRYNVPVGLLNSGKRFSAVQALLDIEAERWLVEAGQPIDVAPETMLVEQIRRVGIGGHSLSEAHTLQHLRRSIWYPDLMDRALCDVTHEHERDMIAAAAQRVDRILSRDDLYEADDATTRAIDGVVRAAEKELLA